MCTQRLHFLIGLSNMVNSLLDTYMVAFRFLHYRCETDQISSLFGRSLLVLLFPMLCSFPFWMSLFGEWVQPLQSTLLCSVASSWFTHRSFDE